MADIEIGLVRKLSDDEAREVKKRFKGGLSRLRWGVPPVLHKDGASIRCGRRTYSAVTQLLEELGVGVQSAVLQDKSGHWVPKDVPRPSRFEVQAFMRQRDASLSRQRQLEARQLEAEVRLRYERAMTTVFPASHQLPLRYAFTTMARELGDRKRPESDLQPWSFGRFTTWQTGPMGPQTEVSLRPLRQKDFDLAEGVRDFVSCCDSNGVLENHTAELDTSILEVMETPSRSARVQTLTERTETDVFRTEPGIHPRLRDIGLD